QGITELQEQFCLMVDQKDKAQHFISAIRADKPRYIRDQLIILLDAAKSASPAIISKALDYCCDNNIRGAADFKSIIAHLQESETIVEEIPLELRRNPLNNQLPDQA